MQKESTALVTVSHWKLLRYLDLTQLEAHRKQNEIILDNISKSLYFNAHNDPNIIKDPRRANALLHTLLPQLKLLSALNIKCKNILDALLNATPTKNRQKRFIFDGLGTAIKWFSGNLDASDGERYESAINRLQTDDKELHNLLKQQVSVVTDTIETFNKTIGQLTQNEQNLKQKQDKIINIVQENLVKTMLTSSILETSDYLMQLHESFTIILNELTEVLEAINFSKLNILHPSIIESKLLLEELQKISNYMTKCKLPLPPRIENIPHYLNIIKTSSYKTSNRLIFVLQIPLVTLKSYSYYHLYSLPAKTTVPNIFSTIIPLSPNLAISDDNTQYFIPKDCKTLTTNEILCLATTYHLIDNNSPCEIQLILHTGNYNTCQKEKLLLKINENKIQPLNDDSWLAFLVKPINIMEDCSPNTGQSVSFSTLKETSILKFTPGCSLHIGSIQILNDYTRNSSTNYTIDLPEVAYDCCEQDTEEKTEDIKPINLQHVNLDNLRSAKDQLFQINESLNQFDDNFINRKTSWFIMLVAVICILIFIIYCCRNCCPQFKRKHITLCAPFTSTVTSCFHTPKRRTSTLSVNYQTAENNSPEVIFLASTSNITSAPDSKHKTENSRIF